MASDASSDDETVNNDEEQQHNDDQDHEGDNEKTKNSNQQKKHHNPNHAAHNIAGAEPHPEDEEKTLINWASDDDPENPVNWSLSRKWAITGTVCFVSFLVGINSTAPTSAATEINERFGVSDAHFPNSFWLVTAWNVAAGVVPMIVLPLMETFGIRWWYLGTYILFTIFIIPQAVAMNFATLIVVRVFAGAFGGVLQNVVDGVVSDIWEGEHARSLPLTMYVFCYLGGVTFGPVYGGAVISHLNWRWIFYIQLIINGAFFPIVFWLIPETHGPIILGKRSKSISQEHNISTSHVHEAEKELKELLYEAAYRPAQLLTTEPAVAFMTLLSSFAFGLVFNATQSVGSIVYPEAFGFSESSAGLVQVSLFIGEFVGAVACVAQNEFFWRSHKRNEEQPGTPIPEARLPLSVFGSFVGLSGGLFWYGWTSTTGGHWILPSIGLGFIGFGIMTVVQAVTTYITDSYASQASSAIAAVSLGENLFGAFLPLSAQRMYGSLGFHWATTTLAFLALVLSFAPVVLWSKGHRVRAKSDFAEA